MRRHAAQPFAIPPRPAQEPLIGADALAAVDPPAPVVVLPPAGPAHLVGAAGDGQPLIGADALAEVDPPAPVVVLPPAGPAHLVGAAGDGHGPAKISESPTVIVTDMELPTFDFQFKLPELDFDEY